MLKYTAISRTLTVSVLAAVVGMAGCGRGPAPIVVGAKNSTEQAILSEIIAQYLERRMPGQQVDRRPNLGGTAIAFQSLQGGEIGLYPEYSGTIETEILKEVPASDPGLILERTRGELRRISQSELLEPLGFDNSFVMVVRRSDPQAAKISTLSEAARSDDGWKMAANYEFQQRGDGMAALSQYKLPMKSAPRSIDSGLLFKALSDTIVTLVAANATDGILNSQDYKILEDDRHMFTPQQACILVRQEVLASHPGLRAVLAGLSGKISNQQMRTMNARVDLAHDQPKDVAAVFLAEMGVR